MRKEKPRIFGSLACLLWVVLTIAAFVGCADDDDDDNNDDLSPTPGDDDNDASPADDDDTSPVGDDDDNDNDDNDNNDNDNDDDDNDDNDDSSPYWAGGQDLGPASLEEYRPLDDQGLSAWEWSAGMLARDALLQSTSVKWVATLDVETGIYYLWHPGGEMSFTRSFDEDGMTFDILTQVGDDPFPNQDPLYAAGYDEEIALLENPNNIQMTEHGYAENDPRVGWIPDAAAGYPDALFRITQVFDSPAGPDLAFDVHAAHGGGTGTHGNLGLLQSRVVLLFSGAGIKPGVLLDAAARLADLAPTALALLGADVVEGIDERGRRVTNNFLPWQDGHALAEVMTNPHVQGLSERVVVLLFDGLSPNELYYHYEHRNDGGLDLPNFFRLIENGTFYRGGAITGWPSISLPGHTLMGAGVVQGKHGLMCNDGYLRTTGERFSFNWFFDHLTEILADPSIAENYYKLFYADERGFENLFAAIHRNFGDWDIAQPGTWGDAYTACVNELTFLGADYGYYEILKLLAALLPDAAKWDDEVYELADMTVPLQISATLADPTHQPPQLTLASFYTTDHQGELHGPHSPALREALVTLDERVGAILDAYERRGLMETTTFIVTSDHGMELLKPGSFDPWSTRLTDAGVQAIALGGDQLLYLLVMRLLPDVAAVNIGVPVTFTVTVLDDDTQAPLAGVEVAVAGGECDPCTATTDAAGAATLTVTPTSPDGLTLTGARADFCPASTTIPADGDR